MALKTSVHLLRLCSALGFLLLACDGNDSDDKAEASAESQFNLKCSQGQVAMWDDSSEEWACGDLPPMFSPDGQFAQSNQTCAVGRVVTGINEDGTVECARPEDSQLAESDVDAFVEDNGFAYSNDLASIATSGSWSDLADVPGDLADGDDDTQLSESEVDAMVSDNGFATSASLSPLASSADWSDIANVPADLADGDNDGLCYTRWGEWGCASGFSEVLRGRPGGHESFEGGGVPFSNVECVSSSASTLQSWGATYANRLMRGDAEGDGMQKVPSRCSTCCRGGCYTAFGTNSCAAGYTRVYAGRTGGVEMYVSPASGAKTLCIDETAPATETWATGYDTRLMRHRETPTGNNGMERVQNTCAMCCAY